VHPLGTCSNPAPCPLPSSGTGSKSRPTRRIAGQSATGTCNQPHNGVGRNSAAHSAEWLRHAPPHPTAPLRQPPPRSSPAPHQCTLKACRRARDNPPGSARERRARSLDPARRRGASASKRFGRKCTQMHANTDWTDSAVRPASRPLQKSAPRSFAAKYSCLRRQHRRPRPLKGQAPAHPYPSKPATARRHQRTRPRPSAEPGNPRAATRAAWPAARALFGNPTEVIPGLRMIDSSAMPPRHAGEGRYLRLLFVAARKAVDTGLRRHDDVCGAGGSILRVPGIRRLRHRIKKRFWQRGNRCRRCGSRPHHGRGSRRGRSKDRTSGNRRAEPAERYCLRLSTPSRLWARARS
jgi:hypothetical protein